MHAMRLREVKEHRQQWMDNMGALAPKMVEDENLELRQEADAARALLKQSEAEKQKKEDLEKKRKEKKSKKKKKSEKRT